MKKFVSRSILLFVPLFLGACGRQVSVGDLKANDWIVNEISDEADFILSFTDDVVSFTIDASSFNSTASNQWEAIGEKMAKRMLQEFEHTFEYTLNNNIMTWEDYLDGAEYTVTRENKNIVLTPTENSNADKKIILRPHDKNKEASSSIQSSKSESNTSETKKSSSADKTDSSTGIIGVIGSGTASSDSTLGRRSNPVPLDTPFTFDTVYHDESFDEIDANVTMTVSNVIRGEEAFDYMISVDDFNKPAPEGKEWVVFDVEMLLNKGSHDDPFRAHPEFVPVSSTGEEVSQESLSYLGNEEFGGKDLYEGGSEKGKVALLVPIDDETLIKFDDFRSRVFFRLQ